LNPKHQDSITSIEGGNDKNETHVWDKSPERSSEIPQGVPRSIGSGLSFAETTGTPDAPESEGLRVWQRLIRSHPELGVEEIVSYTTVHIPRLVPHMEIPITLHQIPILKDGASE